MSFPSCGPFKTCKHCGKTYANSTEHFPANGQGRPGSRCRDCKRQVHLTRYHRIAQDPVLRERRNKLSQAAYRRNPARAQKARDYADDLRRERKGLPPRVLYQGKEPLTIEEYLSGLGATA